MEALAERIEDAKLRFTPVNEEDSTREWIPCSIIENLITETEVERTLDEVKYSAKWETDVKTLKHFVLGERKALRLFALLVYTGLVCLLELFYRHDFADEMFPIRLKDIDIDRGKGGRTIVSIKTKREVPYTGGQNIRAKNIDELSQLWQGVFFAPIFRHDQLEYKLSSSCRLPFLAELETDKRKLSNFSIVKHYVIHPDHIAPTIRDKQIVSCTPIDKYTCIM